MGADRNKLLLPLLDRPVLAWTLQAALQATSITWIGVVGQESDRGAITQIMEAARGQAPSKPLQWIEGGSTRQESVLRGLSGLPASQTIPATPTPGVYFPPQSIAVVLREPALAQPP